MGRKNCVSLLAIPSAHTNKYLLSLFAGLFFCYFGFFSRFPFIFSLTVDMPCSELHTDAFVDVVQSIVSNIPEVSIEIIRGKVKTCNSRTLVNFELF